MVARKDREEDAWLSDAQLSKLSRADEVDDLHSPIPTQVVSNGEHMPIPQTEEQHEVETRIRATAQAAAEKLGISRRGFLATSGGMAASFLAMNEVFGEFFRVEAKELDEPGAHARNAPPSDLFVFDDQLHMVRSSQAGPFNMLSFAQGHKTGGKPKFEGNPFNERGELDELGHSWSVLNPQLDGAELNESLFHIVRFIKDVFLDSQVTVGLMSNATLGVFPPDAGANGRPPRNVSEGQAAAALTAAQTVAIRNFVNQISGSQRMLAHGQIYPGRPNLDFMAEQIERNDPDSWKGYTIATSAKVDDDPDSAMRPWRLDDEKIAYPTFELIAKRKDKLKTRPGFFNICIHKGFSPDPVDTPEMGNPTDIPKAARDWPQFNFIIYHSCFGGMSPFIWNRPVLDKINGGAMRNGEPDIVWLTQFAQTCSDLPNVYAEIGSTFATNVITFPTVCAHIMGQLLKHFGEDRVLFGSDGVFYGAPQWQIEALWRFQIPEKLQKQFGYPALTEQAKRKILGLNSARLYHVSSEGHVAENGVYRPVPKNYEQQMPKDLKTMLEFPGYRQDALAKAREQYVAAGATPNHTRMGWVRTEV